MVPAKILCAAGLFLSLWPALEGAKILAMVTLSSPSHYIWNRSLLIALAERGHEVVIVSPDEEETPVPNVRNILLEDSYKTITENFVYSDKSDMSSYETISMVANWGPMMCEQQLSSRGGRKLIELSKSGAKFDLIVTEAMGCDCFFGFIHKFGYPPVVGVSAGGVPMRAFIMAGAPDNPSYIPNTLQSFTDRMSFLERLTNTVTVTVLDLLAHFYTLPRVRELVSGFLNEDLPPFSQLERNFSLILVNTQPGLDYSRPLPPNIIPVGGMHITPSRPLPKDLKEFMDGAKDGVIFFSLGSNVKSNQLDPAKIEAFVETFRGIPQRVLWKWESNSLPGKPNNVMVGKWLPQRDILGHPKVRLFITHCGQLSTQEATYHGVPILGVPFFFDQHINLKKFVALGVGEGLEYMSVTKETVSEALSRVLNNESYRENMKRLSAVFKDQPQTPLQRALFWTEFVIRHGGAPHLRLASMDLAWYQYWLLDVLAVVVLCIALLTAVASFVLKMAWKTLRGKRTAQGEKKRN